MPSAISHSTWTTTQTTGHICQATTYISQATAFILQSVPTSTKPPPTSAKPQPTSAMMFMRRRKKLKECQDNSPIDADGYQPVNPAREEQPWLPDLGLSKCDQHTLISPNTWLTDVEALKNPISSFDRDSELAVVSSLWILM